MDRKTLPRVLGLVVALFGLFVYAAAQDQGFDLL